ncbi:DUF6456 domain-containing protein [Pararhizobium mangrovi]|uniref:DUF6456 domain-containing protein n=1 Tax=Pararhizobium mangrovi TaxID=2590452 RepID=A0A506UHD0_9HYPH|nr:DUF6456 domain-containing protein [Pararhizobium mangrovi]TPW32725.1 hypothetical protein FJU11_00415 [Pararhizobium mangrovi]
MAERGRDLPAMLRFLARGQARSSADAGGAELIMERDGSRKSFARATVHEALGRGLVTRRGTTFGLDPAGRAFLRRAHAAAGDEAFAAQHGERVSETHTIGAEERTVRVNAEQSPLAALARLKGREKTAFLDERAVAAGERLLADFTRGQMQPRVSANWEASIASRGSRSGGDGAGELTEAALAARLRMERALDAVGPELSGVLLDVCCFQKGLAIVERERRWPARSAKLMLKTALAALARHYQPPATGSQARRGREYRWRAPGS